MSAEKKKPTPINIRSVYVLSVEFFLIMLSLRFLKWDSYKALLSEDGPFEYLQALLYLVAAVYAFKLARYLFAVEKNRFLAFSFFLISAFTLVVAFEEISWGQRLFDFEVPQSIVENNRQNEFNVHNLGPVQDVLHAAYVLVGLYGMFSGVLYSMFAKGKAWSSRFEDFGIDFAIIVPKRFAWFFIPVFAFYLPYEFLRELEWVNWLHSRDQELVELFLSLGWVLLIQYKYISRKYA